MIPPDMEEKHTNTTSRGQKIAKVIPSPPKVRCFLCLIPLFNEGMQVGSNLQDLFCMYVFELELPVGKL